MVEVFKKRKFELLDDIDGVKREWRGITASVHEIERARECVTILLNNVWHSLVIAFGCNNS